MTRKTVLNNIRRLHVPERAKHDLIRLSRRAKKLVEKILLFLRRHQQFAESVLLGAIAAYLLSLLPVLGRALGLLALVTGAAIGLMRELGGALRDTFGQP